MNEEQWPCQITYLLNVKCFRNFINSALDLLLNHSKRTRVVRKVMELLQFRLFMNLRKCVVVTSYMSGFHSGRMCVALCIQIRHYLYDHETINSTLQKFAKGIFVVNNMFEVATLSWVSWEFPSAYCY